MPGKRRTQAEIIAELDRKIAYHNAAIAKLDARKGAMIAPKSGMKDVKAAIHKLGLSVEDAIALLEKKSKA